jgi:putative flippase GtrA
LGSPSPPKLHQMPIFKKVRELFFLETFSQLRRFLLIGGISTLISFSVFTALIRLCNFHYILANFFAFALSVIFSYNMNKKWSFAVEKGRSHLFGYSLIYLSSLVLGTLILKIAIGIFGIIPEIAFIVSLFFTTTMNFIGIKFFVFKK